VGGSGISVGIPSTLDQSLADYTAVLDPERIHRLRTLVNDLDDTRVLNFYATANGAGVAELLVSLVPLCDELGVTTDWHVMYPTSSSLQSLGGSITDCRASKVRSPPKCGDLSCSDRR
jgi:hypothetical protein